MTVERETSMRRVMAVMHHPAVAPWCPIAQGKEYTPPMGERALYFRVGKGLMVYLKNDEFTEVHAALLPGDGGPKATEAIREQFQHLFAQGVKRIVGVPRNPLAERKARAVGMKDTGQKHDGFPIYEVTNVLR